MLNVYLLRLVIYEYVKWLFIKISHNPLYIIRSIYKDMIEISFCYRI